MPDTTRDPATITPAQSRQLLATAHALADTAGKAITPYFRRTHTIENKDTSGGFDPVTTADKKAEQAMRRQLAKLHPDHGISGEEFADTASLSPFRWVLDPIDGTRAFMSGFPLWGTLIGLMHHDRAVIGIMDQPYTQERFWSDGRASYLTRAGGPSRRIKTRPCADLASATLVSTSPDLFTKPVDIKAFDRVKSSVRMTRYGGDCYAYCMLAAGHIDLVVETGLKAVDIAALIPIIEHAGGRVSTWTGGSAVNGGSIIASGDPALHDKAIRLLASAKAR